METLESVLGAHQGIFDSAKESLDNLPEKRGGLPLTFAEATAYIQHKEEEKRRREAKKDRQKQRSGPPIPDTIPGLVPGPPETSPFWLVTEEYFRDVTKEDVAALLPTFASPVEDPIYLIPPIGRHYSGHDALELGTHNPSALQRGSRQPAHAPLLKDRVSELKAQAAAEAVPLRDAEAGGPGEAAANMALDDTQRKSRRLVAKAEKQAEARQFEDDYVFGGENQLGAACLLQGSSVKDLSLLISQVVALLDASMEQASEEMGLAAGELEQVLAVQSADGKETPLAENVRSSFQSWLRQKVVDILPQRKALAISASPQPAVEEPKDTTGQSRPEGGSQAVTEGPPQPQEGTQLHPEAESETAAEQATQLDDQVAVAPEGMQARALAPADLQQAAQPDAAEGMQINGSILEALQQAQQHGARVASESTAADVQHNPVAASMQPPLQELGKQNDLPLAQSVAPLAADSAAQLSEPSLGNGLQDLADAPPPGPEPNDHDSAKAQVMPDVKPDLALPPLTAGLTEVPAEGGDCSHGTDASQAAPLAAPESDSQQGAAEAVSASLPPSLPPPALALKPSRPQSESREALFSCLPCSVTSMAPDQAAKLPTWAAWQEALRAAPASAQASAADDEIMHPYTRRLLVGPPSQYVLRPDLQDDSRGGGMALSGIHTPTGVTPSVSGEDGSALTASKDRGDGDVQSAHTPRQGFSFTAIPSHLSTGGEAAAAFEPSAQASPAGAPEGAAAAEQLKSEPIAYSHEDTAQMAERAASGSMAGPSQGHDANSSRAGPDGTPHTAAQPYQLVQVGTTASGKRPGEQGSKTGKRGAGKGGPTALAVQAAIAAGPHEGGLEEQWEQLAAAGSDLAAAPDDEVLAEMLALQGELLQQAAVNRARLRGVVASLLEDAPRQHEAALRRKSGIEFARQYHDRIKALKRGAKREKREAAARDALKEAQAAMPTSPRQAASRLRGERGTTPTRTWQGEMVDMLASRKGEEEALCAICADGTSVDPNVIVFCERCDLAVHQLCYGIEQIPSGEWLCWPCRVHEENLRAAGVPQKDIRPPRWELHSSPEGRKILEGGSLAAECALCPVRQGAFRQTVDTHQWVHQVCALWTPDVRLRRGADLAVVEGVPGLGPERWAAAACSVCGSAQGVVLRCGAGHCSLPFHTLCARNAGLYLAARGEVGQKTVYRAYCALHSEAQRRRDMELAAGGGTARKKAEGKRAAKEEAAQQAALRALAGREAHWDTLERARLELESLRMLLERVGRREKVKKQLVLATWEAMKLRAGNLLPGWQACQEAEALPPISARLAARQGQQPGSGGPQPDHSAQQPASAFSGAAQAPAFGHASSAPKTLPGRHMQTHSKQGTGSLLHLPGLSSSLHKGSALPDYGSSDALLDPLLLQQPGGSFGLDQVPLLHGSKAPETTMELPSKMAALEKKHDVAAKEPEALELGEDPKAASTAEDAGKGPPSKTAPKRKRDSANMDAQKGKRAKKGEAKAMDVDEAPDRPPEGSPGTRSRSLRSSGEQVDKNCLMTSTEAAAANSRMPKGFKYMPIRKSSRPGSSKGGRS